MKITILLLLTLLTPVLITAQKFSFEQTEEHKKLFKDNKVKSLTISYYGNRDSENRDSVTVVEGRKFLHSEFDNRGNRIKYTTSFNQDGIPFYLLSLKHDSVGNLISSSSLNISDKPLLFKGDAKHKIEKRAKNATLKSDTILINNTYKYDNKRNLIYYSEFAYGGMIDTRIEYEYNKDNQLIKQLVVNSGDTVVQEFKYTYKNVSNQIIKKYYSRKDTSYIGKTVYKKDKEGNIIEEVDYSFIYLYYIDHPKEIYDSVITKHRLAVFSSSNTKIQETTSIYYQGRRKMKFSSKISHKYDDHGNEIQFTDFDKKDKETYQSNFAFIYGSTGLILEQRVLYNEEIVNYYKYEYTFFK